ncbi:MAG: thiamine phosphate synthase [Thermomicrobiales bacterium]
MDNSELRERLAVYYVADPEQTNRNFLEIVEQALAGGATAVQLRAKQMSGREMFDLGVLMRERCAAWGALFFVNDRVDVGIAVAADGVHVGVNDLPLLETRALVGADVIVGFSPVDAEGVRRAAERGADYVGVGPVFTTGSKSDAEPPLGVEGTAALAGLSPVPAVAIGGIQIESAGVIVRAGLDGVAVISAIQGAADPREAAAQLKREVEAAKLER